MRLALLATILAGCLSVPEPGASMCSTSSDCDQAHGEVCDDGVCYGDPPSVPLAAIVSPPSARTDLVAAEFPQLTIPPNGLLPDLTLDAPISFAGRVEAQCTTCDQSTVAAQITVTRPSQFMGGPGFQTSIASIDSSADTSFAAALPRTADGDPAYEVTITPRDDASGAPAPSQQVPPLRLSLSLTDNSVATYTLGGDSLVQLDGNLFDANLTPLGDYRVYALGHWDASEPVTIVSTIDYTSSGEYHLTLSDNLVDTVEIVAEPYAMGVTAATLHLPHVDLSGGSHDLVAPTGLGTARSVTVSITAQNPDGTVTGVTGAHVFASTILTPMTASPSVPTHATLDVDAITDGNGLAHLVLLDGDGAYQMHVAPPVGSTFGAAFAQPLPLTTCGTDAAPCALQLENRVAIHGVITDAQGNPIKGMTVTAKPSLQFLLALQTAPQQFLAQIPAATSVTPDSGDYVVFVDHLIGDVWGSYDLDLEPADNTTTPHWLESDVELVRDKTVDKVAHDIHLTSPAFIHGSITDPVGTAVPDGEVRIYAIVTDESACTDAVNAPPNCVVPAIQAAHASSDGSGTVKLTLPR